MTTLAITALTIATLLYVLWPLIRSRPEHSEKALPLEQLEPPPGDR